MKKKGKPAVSETILSVKNYRLTLECRKNRKLANDYLTLTNEIYGFHELRLFVIILCGLLPGTSFEQNYKTGRYKEEIAGLAFFDSNGVNICS